MIALAFVFAQPAFGHDAFEITTEARLAPATLRLEVTMARSTARKLVGAELPPDLSIEPATFERIQPLFEAHTGELFAVSAGSVLLQPREIAVGLTRENDVEFRVSYALEGEGTLKIDAIHLRNLPPSYGAVITVLSDKDALLAQKLLTLDDSALDLPQRSGLAQKPTPTVTKRAQFYAFSRLGIEHILTGYDHLLFLVGLLVACRRFRTVATLITCFTLAHSLTLALAALNIVALGSRIIEPLIAASIVFVGVENLVRSGEPKGRWAVTFAFGLIHGFGFAGALRQAGLGKEGASLVVPLFSFNLGVELGQILVAAIFLSMLWRLRKWPAFERHNRAFFSMIVVLCGSCWLIERVFF